MLRFEWDDDKNRKNIAKHGIDFEIARQIFDGPCVSSIDDREDYGETRELTLGLLYGVLVLAVLHTDRDGVIRIISARKALKSERLRYEQAL